MRQKIVQEKLHGPARIREGSVQWNALALKQFQELNEHLVDPDRNARDAAPLAVRFHRLGDREDAAAYLGRTPPDRPLIVAGDAGQFGQVRAAQQQPGRPLPGLMRVTNANVQYEPMKPSRADRRGSRSEEHTSELQS